MIELTYDPDARTLYAYFASIDEGQDVEQLELDGAFLLDGAGQILGMRVELPAEHDQRLLQAARQHEEAHYDPADSSLRLLFSPEAPASEEAFPYAAIVDLDRSGRALGVEFIADPELDLGQRLSRIEPFIVEVFGDTDDEQGEAEADGEPVGAVFGGDEPEGVLIQPEATAQRPAPPDGGQQATDTTVRSGFVALVGKPNVGKSTLLNAYLGTKVSIVSPKPQTTRIAVRGILNREDAQVVFIDTPGLHQPRSRLGEYMVEAARRAIPDADVVCLVVDASQPPSAQDRRIAQLVRRSRKPAILVLNKIDIARQADVVLREYQELGPWETEIAVSAARQQGLEGLIEEIVTRLPQGPRMFPSDQITDLSEREHVAELIREKVLLNTQQEVPHGVAVEIEEWEQRGERLYIRATVNVEREGHKAIVIGENGQMLKKIGAAARYEIEHALEQPVYLDLWVKIRKDWRRDPNSLRWLGYDVKRLR